MVSRHVRARRKLGPLGAEVLTMARFENVERFARWLGVALPSMRSSEKYVEYKRRCACRVARALVRGEHTKR